MSKIFFVSLVAGVVAWGQALACTSVIVGKDASVDGSVMCTYSCDSYGTFHPMYHFPAAKHEKGE
ncbi:MAG: C69 family dipeptidase, partial [bacterium]|nr:C69 family dipeptidase [bacterium]